MTAHTQPQTLSISSAHRMRSGYQIPALGYGVYQTPAAITESVTLHALQTGYRHVDSARAYRNEEPCAGAIRNSGINRGEIFFTSKIPPKQMGYEKAKVWLTCSTNTQTRLSAIG